MTAYIILITLLIGMLWLSRIRITTSNINIDGNLYYAFLSWMFLVFVEGMRSVQVGEDLKGYIADFLQSPTMIINSKFYFDFSKFEPGYNILKLIIYNINSSPQFYIFATSLIIVTLHVFFLYKNSSNYPLSLLLFMGFDHFFTSMVSLRQYIAMGIVAWCFPLTAKNKYKEAILVSMVAMYIHQSSIIPAVIIIVLSLFKSKKSYIKGGIIISCAMVPLAYYLYLFAGSIFVKYGTFYVIGITETRIGAIRIIYMLIQAILIECVLIRKEENERLNLLALLMIVAMYIGFASAIVPFAFRLGYFFDYYMLLMIPELIKESSVNQKYLNVLCVVLSLVFFFYYLSVNPGLTVPYSFYY